MGFFSDNFTFQPGLFHGAEPTEKEDSLVSSNPVMSNEDFFGIDTSLPFGPTEGFFSDDTEKMDFYDRQDRFDMSKKNILDATNRYSQENSPWHNLAKNSVTGFKYTFESSY